MKLSPFLVQFLATHGQLSLQGIGRFSIQPGETLPVGDSDPNSKTIDVDIRFTGNKSEKTDMDFVSYVAKEAGKMKSLAESDIDSYTEQVKEFLNIGKPFLIDGIGTLTKHRTGEISFAQGHFTVEKPKETPIAEKPVVKSNKQAEERNFDYHDILTSRKPRKDHQRRVVMTLVIIGGIALAVWGGYSLYKNGDGARVLAASEDSTRGGNAVEVLPVAASLTGLVEETPGNRPETQHLQAGTYRFIVREGTYKTAIRRYNYLKEECLLDVHMSTKDSSVFKVFFRLPATPADTARIADSLNILYVSSGQKKVSVELP